MAFISFNSFLSNRRLLFRNNVRRRALENNHMFHETYLYLDCPVVLIIFVFHVHVKRSMK